ncbi:MAG: hypothetical protein AB1420_06280 [Bacillota bacterium]
MASKKKLKTRILEKAQECLKREFGNRILKINYGEVCPEWISAHAQAEIRVVVKRANLDVISTIYDVLYKLMYSHNFNQLVSLRVIPWSEDNIHRVPRTIKGKVLSRTGQAKEAVTWKAV